MATAPDDTGVGEVAQPPPSSATKAEVVAAAVAAGFFDAAEDAETWTKAELLTLWEA